MNYSSLQLLLLLIVLSLYLCVRLVFKTIMADSLEEMKRKISELEDSGVRKKRPKTLGLCNDGTSAPRKSRTKSVKVVVKLIVHTFY